MGKYSGGFKAKTEQNRTASASASVAQAVSSSHGNTRSHLIMSSDELSSSCYCPIQFCTQLKCTAHSMYGLHVNCDDNNKFNCVYDEMFGMKEGQTLCLLLSSIHSFICSSRHSFVTSKQNNNNSLIHFIISFIDSFFQLSLNAKNYYHFSF